MINGNMQIDEWIKFQEENSTKIVPVNSFDIKNIKFIGGVDISFNKKNPVMSCAYLTIMSYPACKIIYGDHQKLKLDISYVSGFLGFREVPIYIELLNKLKIKKPEYYPDVVMVDGFGTLHPRNFGSASHLGFLADIPTIGVAKTLLCFDGLNENEIKVWFRLNCRNKGEFIDLKGKSGKLYGVALKSTQDTINPIYVSIGHKICLDSAIEIVSKMCKFRIPEPIRNSDIKSKLFF